MGGIKSFSLFTVLELDFSFPNKLALQGARCIVVDKGDFDKEYKELIALTGEASEAFISVVWDKNDPNYNGAVDGFYYSGRFNISENQEDFRSNLNVKKTCLKDNEGRETCFKCGEQTKLVQGFSSSYTVCPRCKI
jgi:hypothetical protein